MFLIDDYDELMTLYFSRKILNEIRILKNDSLLSTDDAVKVTTTMAVPRESQVCLSRFVFLQVG
jgi:hypothetical protein